MRTTIIEMSAVLARGILFTILLFFRPLVVGGSSVIAGLSLLGFLGTFFLMRSETVPLYGFLTLGMTAVAVAFVYNWILMLLSPPGFVMDIDGR